MRYIEDLKDLYKGEEIWIHCTGHTLDDYDNDFFDDKIFIGLNWSMCRFPPLKEYQYEHWYHSIYGKFREWVDKKHPEYYKQIILPYPHEWVTKPEEYGKHAEEAIWLFWDETQANKEEDFRLSVERILVKKKSPIMRGWNTVLHTAIQSAVVMGAKKITLAGCSGHSLKDRNHAIKGGMGEHYKDKPEEWHIENCTGDKKEMPIEEQNGTSNRKMRHKSGTIWLAKSLEPYNIEICRHFAKTGYAELWKID